MTRRGRDWRPDSHPSLPPLRELPGPARTAFEVTPRQVIIFGVPIALLTVLLTQRVSSGDEPELPLLQQVVLFVLLFAFAGWACLHDVRHGPGWVASRRFSRWRWVDLESLASARLKRPRRWPSTIAHYDRRAWAVVLRDSAGHRVKVPALALRDDELRTLVNAALRQANLPDVGALFGPRGLVG